MQISSRFTIAIHMFGCIELFSEERKVTSEFLSSSINVNPVIIRNIMLQLKRAGLVNVARGSGGITLTRDSSRITFYDIYKATDLVDDDKLFHFHENPNFLCPVGRNINNVLEWRLDSIQKAMEEEMKKYTVKDVLEDIKSNLASGK